MEYPELVLAMMALLTLVVSERTLVRCGNENMPIPQAMYDNGVPYFLNLTEATPKKDVLNDSVVISTYVHFVSSSIDDTINSAIQRQLLVLNQAFEPAGFQFRLDGISDKYNEKWATADIRHAHKRAMKKALRKGTYGTLNLYIVDHLGGGYWGPELTGHCLFPTNHGSTADPAKYEEDGCVIHVGTLPGGVMMGRNLGFTAVHEVGHFLGLFHVFQGFDCSGGGDMVDDTPMQSKATLGCPAAQNSCSKLPGVDSIHNFMDYSDDVCMEGFTVGQIARMKQMWGKYRAGK